MLLYSLRTSMTQCIVSTSPFLHIKAAHLRSREGQPAALQETERFQIIETILPTYRTAISQPHSLRTGGQKKQRHVLLAVKWNRGQSQI